MLSTVVNTGTNQMMAAPVLILKEGIMRNDRQTYFSGNFDCCGNSIAQPIKTLDKQNGCSVIVILGAFVMFGIICDLIISRM